MKRKKDGNAVLATYRCQLNTTKVELKYYAAEGQRGTLLAYVTPMTQPKSAQLCSIRILPLLLHFRIHHIPENRLFNCLTLKGAFSLAEMHSWIRQCLPDISEKTMTEDKTEYRFQSSLTATVLSVSYMRGEAQFKSDSLSTIYILKEWLSKEATRKKLKVDFTIVVCEESLFCALRTIHPTLEQYYTLGKQLLLLEALKDVDSAQVEPLIALLSEEYKTILRNEQTIRSEVAKKPFHCDRLRSAVIDLFVDWHKYKGLNGKPKLSSFIDVLKNEYTFEKMCSFF